MAGDSVISDPIDPLQSLFGVSLFPRTIRSSTNASMPSDPNDLDSVHNFMKSVTLSSPEKLFDEAKAIVNGGSEILKSKFANFVECVGTDVNAVAPGGKENLRERRPGLGRKRAQFTLKTNVRPSASLESDLDIDQLQDPEEFFAAFEKAENAKKEIQRLKGGTICDSEDYDPTTNRRGRRPGILGKSVSYKHRYSSLLAESDNKLISLQETLELDVHDSLLDKDYAGFEAPETNVAGSITTAENRVNEILDGLLSSSEDYNGDVLLESLNIKPIDLGKLSLPDFHDVGSTDFMGLQEKMPKGRKILSNISNLAKEGEARMKQKKVAESPISPVASPTPTKSPFASLLEKRSSQSSSLRDPSSPLNVDLSEPRNAYSVEDNDLHTDQTARARDADNLVGSFGDETSERATESHIHFIEHGIGDGLVDNSNRTDAECNQLAADMHEAAETSAQINSHTDHSTQIGSDKVGGIPSEAAVPAHPEVNMPQLQIVENLYADQPSSVATEDNPVITPSVTAKALITKKSKKLLPEDQGRAKRLRGESREMKALSRRKSLTEAGTSFESGVRRSKRIKTRPLEYWKGERFLYGRVNESLKLIGLKYISPGKGDGKVKVKAYVSEDYKEILDLAARH